MALEVLTIQNCVHDHLADAQIGHYLMPQFTKTIDAVNWQVFQAIIADSDGNGKVDANGLFKPAQIFLDMPTQFARNDTKDINGNSSGQHDGGNNQASLTDSSAAWGTNDLIGAYVVNETDGSYGRITANTATGVTATLAGGMDDDWDNNDVYTIGGPASIIRFVLIDFGITSTDIDDTSFGASELTFAGRDLVWNGAFYYKQPRTQVLSALLTMCHSTLRITEKVELHVFSKTSQKTITKADILRQGKDGPSTFSHSVIRQEYSDSGYIAFQEADESQDEFIKAIVPAKASETKISGDVLVVPLVQDSQDAQRIGTLHYQRKFLKEANSSFASKGTLLALQPDDVVTIDDTDYGGTFDVAIDTMFINRDLSIDVRLVKYSVALDDWGDLAPGAITLASDDSGTYWKPVISGPTVTTSSGNPPNLVIGSLIIGTGVSSKYILIDPSNTKIKSSNYVLGSHGAGFSLSPDLFEVGNIACRGMIRTAVFQKNVISAVGGNIVITKGADVLAADMTALDAAALTIEGNESLNVDDLLRIKDGSKHEWLGVTNIGSAPTYTVTRDKAAYYGVDTNPTWQKGAAIVNYGASGDGGILMTASEANAPYMSIFTHTGSPWSALTTRLRIGNLNGFLGYTSNLYGIAIGETNKYLKYDPTNGLRIKGVISADAISTINADIGAITAGTLSSSDWTTNIGIRLDLDNKWLKMGGSNVGAISSAAGVFLGQDSPYLREDCSDISDWTDADGGDGASTQIDNPLGGGKDCFKFDSGSGAGNYAERWRDIGSFGDRIVVEISLYHAALGDRGDGDFLRFDLERDDVRCLVGWASDGLYIYNGAAYVELGTNIVDIGTWTTWILDIDFSTPASATVEVSKNGVSQGSGDCSDDAGGFADGKIKIMQYGNTTANRITYVDYVNVGVNQFYVGDGASKYFKFDGINVTLGPEVSLGINSATWQADGIQLQYNAGNPRFYCGDGVNDYFQFDGTNVTISTSVADAITIKSGANIKIEGGGDINLIGSDTDPGVMNFVGSTNTISFGANAGGLILDIKEMSTIRYNSRDGSRLSQQFKRIDSIPVNNDVITWFDYIGPDSGGFATTYARQEVICINVANLSETGRVNWYGVHNGTWNHCYYFNMDGNAYADVAWGAFSPDITKSKTILGIEPQDYLQWALGDAKKPVKPYKGLYSIDDPPDGCDVASSQEEVEKYGKDSCKISIGVARWAEWANQKILDLESELEILKP